MSFLPTLPLKKHKSPNNLLIFSNMLSNTSFNIYKFNRFFYFVEFLPEVMKGSFMMMYHSSVMLDMSFS